jgi:plastocyanin
MRRRLAVLVLAPALLAGCSSGHSPAVSAASAAPNTIIIKDFDFSPMNIAPGKSVTFTAPTTAGTYSYICQIHQYMNGTLTVK